MKILEIEIWGRSSSDGKPRCGVCTFHDGKVWNWHRSHDTGEYYFTIDSGIPSQWGFGNYGRLVVYPKRVAALTAKLKEMGEA